MKRVSNKSFDTNDAQSNSYNEPAGGFKQVNIGPKLKYLGTAASATPIGTGKQLAIYSAALAFVTMGNSSVASLALGSGGIPVLAGVWNYLSMGEDSHIIASAATVYIFEIVDDTFIR